MAKHNRSAAKKVNNEQPNILELNTSEREKNQQIKIKKLDINLKNEAQEQFWEMMSNKQITLCAGSAGTGKSHLSVLKAVHLLQQEPTKYKKIILTTPAVEADGEKIGFLPGDINEKMAPYIYSTLYLFEKIVGIEKAKRMFEREQVKVIPLNFMRGINIDNSA